MTDIFVSYTSEDLERVKPLVSALEEQGWSVWWDRELVAGPNFHDKIEEALDSVRCVVVVWSATSVKSQWVKTEANEGLERQILIPLLIDDVKPPLAFRMAQTARMFDWPALSGEFATISNGIAELLIAPAANSILSDRLQRSSRSIAVLPFISMSTSEGTRYFAEGLSEDILDVLAQIASIKVASRSASFMYTDRGQDPSVIGDKLNVAYLLEGSVRQQADNLRITAQLIRTEDGFHVWSKSYERTLTDGFEMQTAVAINIAYITESKIDLDILRNSGSQRERMEGIDPGAVEHFINAKDEYRNFLLGEGGDFRTYVQLLKNAVLADSKFCAAYELLANAYLQRHFRGRMSLQEAAPEAHAALNGAVESAPADIAVNTSATGGSFLALLIHLSIDLNYASASTGLRQRLKDDPKLGWAHFHLASIALREGRTSEALRQMAGAAELTVPETPLFMAFTAWIKSVGRDYEGALKASARGLKLAVGDRDRVFILRMHAFALIMSGKTEEAKSFVDEGWHLERSSSPENYIALFTYLGEPGKAKEILTDTRFDLIDHYQLALGHLALGEVDDTFKSIHAGIEDHSPALFDSLLVAEWWNPIREDPRYGEMLTLLDSKVIHTEQFLRNNSAS